MALSPHPAVRAAEEASIAASLAEQRAFFALPQLHPTLRESGESHLPATTEQQQHTLEATQRRAAEAQAALNLAHVVATLAGEEW